MSVRKQAVVELAAPTHLVNLARSTAVEINTDPSGTLHSASGSARAKS